MKGYGVMLAKKVEHRHCRGKTVKRLNCPRKDGLLMCRTWMSQERKNKLWK